MGDGAQRCDLSCRSDRKRHCGGACRVGYAGWIKRPRTDAQGSEQGELRYDNRVMTSVTSHSTTLTTTMIIAPTMPILYVTLILRLIMQQRYE